MNKRDDAVNKSINFIKETTDNEAFKEMTNLIDNISSDKKVDPEILELLGYYTYDDYSEKKKEISK